MLVSVDVESDGPCPGLYSMVSFGAVVVEAPFSKTFYGEMKPISEKYVPEALAISGITRKQHESYSDPSYTIKEFDKWLLSLNDKLTFISDNPAFDWQFINYYLHRYIGVNRFGFSARRIGDIYSGLQKDMRASSKWKSLRDTKHTHNPIDDAKGNAEALLKFKKFGLRL